VKQAQEKNFMSRSFLTHRQFTCGTVARLDNCPCNSKKTISKTHQLASVPMQACPSCLDLETQGTSLKKMKMKKNDCNYRDWD
jgi:hypothetical protein